MTKEKELVYIMNGKFDNNSNSFIFEFKREEEEKGKCIKFIKGLMPCLFKK